MKYRDLLHKKNRKGENKSYKAEAMDNCKPWFGEDSEHHVVHEAGLDTTALHALSRKGLWGLLFFLLASVAAFLNQDFNLYQTFPEAVLQILGCPPPAILIHLALTVYSFTVVVPVLIRMSTGDNPVVGWHHSLYRSVFCLFYLVSTTLPENFFAMVTIGILLYAVEQVGIWSYMYKHLRGAEVSG